MIVLHLLDISYPYLTRVASGNSVNFSVFSLAHADFHPSTTLHTGEVWHMTSVTRPSFFSCETLKTIGGPGNKAMYSVCASYILTVMITMTMYCLYIII